MAMTITTLRNTNQETVIHFASTLVESGTITIADLTATASQARNSDAPVVDIVKWTISGELTSSVTITRNSKLVIAGAPENAPYMENNAWGIPLNIENTSNIVINNLVEKAVTGIIVLRKQAGWSTKFEPATFGSYDDPTQVGS